eukprot:2836320-Rhodomonas_salina.1
MASRRSMERRNFEIWLRKKKGWGWGTRVTTKNSADLLRRVRLTGREGSASRTDSARTAMGLWWNECSPRAPVT